MDRLSFEAALAKRLLDAPQVQAVVGQNIDWDRRWSAGVAAFTLETISDVRPQHYKGFQRLRPTRVQITAWAPRKATAIVLRDIAIAVLTPAATVGGVSFQRASVPLVRAAFDGAGTSTDAQPRGETYRELIDFIFLHDA